MTELRSTSFLVLLFVSSSGLLTNSVQAEGVQIDTNPVDNDAKLNAEYQNQGTWTRNANGSIDLKLYQNYIITKYLETQSLLDSICSLKDGSNGCQPYRLRAEIDLKKFFRSLGKTVKFFDNYLLKYRQQRRERHQKKQNQKKLKPKKQHKKKKNHRPNNSGPAAKEAVFVQAVPTTSAPANARETKSPSATQGPKSPRSTRGPSSATKSPQATRGPSVTRAPSVTRVAPANSRAPARATKGPNVTRNPEFSRAPESSRASGGVSATPPSAVKIR